MVTCGEIGDHWLVHQESQLGVSRYCNVPKSVEIGVKAQANKK